jgi:hypothetical protein
MLSVVPFRKDWWFPNLFENCFASSSPASKRIDVVPIFGRIIPRPREAIVESLVEGFDCRPNFGFSVIALHRSRQD